MPTTLQVLNSSKSSIEVYLTLGVGDVGYIEDVYGIFGIQVHGPKGKFTLNVGEYVEYTPDYPVKAIKGNLAFGEDTSNCRTATAPNGINIFEFNLNNYNLGTPENETIDISCVPGINAHIGCGLSGGLDWNAGASYPLPVVSFENGKWGENSGKVGVFPVGCEECIVQGDPACPEDPLIPEFPQGKRICTVQRPSSEDACNGIVRVSYVGKL